VFIALAFLAFGTEIGSLKHGIYTSPNKVVNATPRVRAAWPSVTRLVSRSTSDTFSLADARENVVNNERYAQFVAIKMVMQLLITNIDFNQRTKETLNKGQQYSSKKNNFQFYYDYTANTESEIKIMNIY
jgi:hypothetical protein